MNWTENNLWLCGRPARHQHCTVLPLSLLYQIFSYHLRCILISWLYYCSNAGNKYILCLLCFWTSKCMLVALILWSKHSPPWLIISSHGDLSLRRSFYTWIFFSSHFSKKCFKYKNICFETCFFVSKTHFWHHLNLFSHFWFHFNSFRCFLVQHTKFW